MVDISRWTSSPHLEHERPHARRKKRMFMAEVPESTRLWNVIECATYLGKSPRWLWTALHFEPVHPSSIPHVRIGKTPRFIP